MFTLELGVVESAIGAELVIKSAEDYHKKIFKGRNPLDATDKDINQKILGTNVSFKKHHHSKGKIIDVIGQVKDPYLIVKLIENTKKKAVNTASLIGDIVVAI
ncbi:MAG: hypothetical protein ABH950_05205 [Candidatus Altiarchaeota archaeon]